MDLFQLYRSMHEHDKNKKEMYTNKYSFVIVLVLGEF